MRCALVFVPCQTVIIGKDNNASLIVLLHQIHVQIPAEAPDPLPEKAAFPMGWHVFCQWETAPEEIGTTFEQRIQLLNMSGELQADFDSVSPFVPEKKKPIHRVIANLNLFPVLAEGHYRLRLSLRKSGDKDWSVSGDHPLQIIHKRVVEPVTS